MRIVSLLPSATEIICAIGARNELVGISHECDYPPDVQTLPALTSPKRQLAETSQEIDSDIRKILRTAMSVYDLDTDLFAELAPDVVVTQDLCDVCAVDFKTVCFAAQNLVGNKVNIVNLRPTQLDDIWIDICKTGNATGYSAAAQNLVAKLKDRLEVLSKRTAEFNQKPKVISIEWIDPVMLGGLWTAEITHIAGGIPLGPLTGKPAKTMDRYALKTLDPDVVVIKPCGYTLQQTSKELDTIRSKLPWDSWPATRDGRVYIADGNAYFNRPGPRIVDSTELLAACLHPEKLPDFVKQYSASIAKLDKSGIQRISPD